MASFFDLLSDERCAQITHVTSDAADWIEPVVARRCPNTVRSADPFHVVAWATEALDQVRRQAWNDARAKVSAPKGVAVEAVHELTPRRDQVTSERER